MIAAENMASNTIRLPGMSAHAARPCSQPGTAGLHSRRTRMAKRLSVIGDRYGRLTVVSEAERGKDYKRRFVCQCSCGRTTTVQLSHLRAGDEGLSCGCRRVEQAAVIGKSNVRHGRSRTREHYVWADMKRRCSQQSHHAYAGYGGRGIRVCDRWVESFEAFFADMGECPDGMSLDRKDNDGNYEPGNCRWSTRRQQQRNRRTNRLITAFGETLCVAEWAERTGLSTHAIRHRLMRGKSPEEALTR